jgi:hypothetical protein
MQQGERIELIKAAAMLTAASLQSEHGVQQAIQNRLTVIDVFEHYYDYLQLKLEASGNANENN